MKKILFFIVAVMFLFSACNHQAKNTSEKEKVRKIQVGVFNGNGASPVCITETVEAVKIDSGMDVRTISAADIEGGVLAQLDVLVFPGGSGSKEYNNLGLSAAQKVKDFGQTQGKGLVGICAGGYLFATTPTYPSLQIVNARNYRKYYDRGRGLIAFTLNEEGKEIFPELTAQDTLYVQYYDGPVYRWYDSSRYTVPANIASDIATHKGYPHGITPGRPAFLCGDYGKGKVFVSVGHPEATAGMRWIVPRMIRWTLDKPLISYGKNVVRPGLNRREILFYPEQKKQEKDDFWKLSGSEEEIIAAIRDLHALRSRPSIRWSIGLLRHNSPKVVLEAAKYIVESEYTPALQDLKQAAEFQTDAATKSELKALLKKLQNMIGSRP